LACMYIFVLDETTAAATKSQGKINK